MRQTLPFQHVNQPGTASYRADLQRHHLIPRQVMEMPSFSRMLAAVGRHRLGYDDFRRNGLLLPASELAALETGMPLHRGPHRSYNQLVIERVGIIEGGWSRVARLDHGRASSDAAMRLDLLQCALRRKLLSRSRRGRRTLLNRRDPLRGGQDFAMLDALVDELWGTV